MAYNAHAITKHFASIRLRKVNFVSHSISTSHRGECKGSAEPACLSNGRRLIAAPNVRTRELSHKSPRGRVTVATHDFVGVLFARQCAEALTRDGNHPKIDRCRAQLLWVDRLYAGYDNTYRTANNTIMIINLQQSADVRLPPRRRDPLLRASTEGGAAALQ